MTRKQAKAARQAAGQVEELTEKKQGESLDAQIWIQARG